jgi:hypothetical protein
MTWCICEDPLDYKKWFANIICVSIDVNSNAIRCYEEDQKMAFHYCLIAE